MRLFYLISFFFFLIGCSTSQSKKTSPIEKDSKYIQFIKKTLPSITEGTSFDQVEYILDIHKQFKGIVLSSGDDKEFTYSYYIPPYEIKLVFCYTKNHHGSFLRYYLNKKHL